MAKRMSPEQLRRNLIGSLTLKYAVLVSVSAGILALVLAKLNGCEWSQSIWRCAIASALCGMLVGMVIHPLNRALLAPPPPSPPPPQHPQPASASAPRPQPAAPGSNP